MAPLLLPAKNAYEISWQGSAGAIFYIVERKEAKAGEWIPIAVMNDAKTAYRPLFAANYAEPGKSYY